MDNPYLRPGDSNLIWDDDVTPEGIAVQFASETSGVDIGVRGGHFWIDELSSSQYDVTLTGLQGYISLLSSAADLSIGVSAYDYRNIVETKSLTGDDEFQGNIVYQLNDGEDSTQVFANDFTLINGFAQVAFKAMPITLFSDYVINVDGPDDDNLGWLVGATIGDGNSDMPIIFTYTYRNLDRDAVVGAFSFADFGGGTTNAQGHTIDLELAVNSSTNLFAAYQSSTIDPNGVEETYEQAQGGLTVVF